MGFRFQKRMALLLATMLALVILLMATGASHARGGGHGGASSLGMRTVPVQGYTRSNGTHVNGYLRSAPGSSHPTSAAAGSSGAEILAVQPTDDPPAVPEAPARMIVLNPNPFSEKHVIGPHPPHKFAVCYVAQSGNCVPDN
jgi:hypothetical protein